MMTVTQLFPLPLPTATKNYLFCTVSNEEYNILFQRMSCHGNKPLLALQKNSVQALVSSANHDSRFLCGNDNYNRVFLVHRCWSIKSRVQGK